MTTITDINLRVVDSGTVLARWTGAAGQFSTIFVDGLVTAGPVLLAGTAKVANVNVPTDRPFTIVIVEDTVSDVPAAPIETLSLRPTITWSKLPGTSADYFILEYRQDGEAWAGWPENDLVPADENEKYFAVQFPIDLFDLGGGFFQFRVSAFDEESGAIVVADEKCWFAHDYGLKPATLSIADNAPGVFDITLTT